jgi:uncharacterized membrane protein
MNKTTALICQIGILLALAASLIGLPLSLFLSLAQIILLLIAHYRLSKELDDRKIFTPFLIANLVSVVFIFAGLFWFTWIFITKSLPLVVEGVDLMDYQKLSETIQDLGEDIQQDEALAKRVGEAVISFGGYFLFATALIALGVVLWAVFLRISLLALAQKTDIVEFKTAAKFYLIGALSMVFLVGFLFLLIGYIYRVIAYFKFRPIS